jgi:hypothetical protein
LLALVNAIMNVRVPKNVENILTRWQPTSFSRRALIDGSSKLWIPCTCRIILLCIFSINFQLSIFTTHNTRLYTTALVSRSPHKFVLRK